MRIRRRQWERLSALLQTVLPTNDFHRRRIGGLEIDSLEDFSAKVPLLTKKDLVADRIAHPPYGTNLTWPVENYTRFCQTSGTTGTPMAWLDSHDDWRGMLACWEEIYDAAGLEPGEDRLFFPFSFGPFLGFWTAFEAATGLGCLVIPGGGMSTRARLRLMLDHRVSVVCCTPTYALHLGETRQTDPEFAGEKFALRKFIVAGEPGGSVPAIRDRILRAWPGATVFDHHGLTETGPVSWQDPRSPERLCILEEHYFAEILDPQTLREVAPGEQGELILTNLHRLGCPVLRYRTGDLVRKTFAEDGTLAMDGGILSRMDDMICVRGVNIFPSAVDAVLRRFPEITEYQVREVRHGALLDLELSIETEPGTATTSATGPALEAALRDTFQLRMPVTIVPPGTLPRFEFKARRWIKEGSAAGAGG